jgi:hypothetical protein
MGEWVAEVVDFISKEAFEGYCSDKMNESDSRVFMCHNILLNFHELVRSVKEKSTIWEKHSQDIIYVFQSKMSQALDFCLAKYPQKDKLFVNREFS